MGQYTMLPVIGNTHGKCVYLLILLITTCFFVLYESLEVSKGKNSIYYRCTSNKCKINQTFSHLPPPVYTTKLNYDVPLNHYFKNNKKASETSNINLSRPIRRRRYSIDSFDYKTAIQIIGAYLAVQKYFEADVRYEESVVKNFYRSFLSPPLGHEIIYKLCGISFRKCVFAIFEASKKSPVLNKLISTKFTHIPNWQEYVGMSKGQKNYFPHASPIDHLVFKGTSAWYMCWYTMMKEPVLAHFMDGGNCLQLLNSVGVGKAVDYRMDDKPFQCALILFCPDFCYGRKDNGNVYSPDQKNTDKGNPCRKFKNKTCTVVQDDNDSFTGLVWNRFNVTCSCSGKGHGYKYDAQRQMCVDIDECLENRYDCRNGKICKNLIGGYVCTCRQGFKFNMDVQMCETPAESRTRELNHLKRKNKNDAWCPKVCAVLFLTILTHAMSLAWNAFVDIVIENSFLVVDVCVYVYVHIFQ